MNTAARLTAYGAVAVLLGAGAFATGSAVDVPTDHLRPTTASGAAGHGTDHGAVGVDVSTPGEFDPVAPKPGRVGTAPGGYEVRLDGDLAPGRAGAVTLTVTRDGRPVTDLQPYLGSYGHLVALRTGDLGYLHVHPQGSPGDGATTPGPRITFHTEVPSAGVYRLFLDFRHDGRVRTAQFTVPTVGSSPAPSAGDGHTHAEGGHR